MNLVDKQILFRAGDQVKYWYFLIKGELSFSYSCKSNKKEKTRNKDDNNHQSFSEEKLETMAQNSPDFANENSTQIQQKIIDNSRNALRSCFTAEENSRINTTERVTRSRTPGMRIKNDNCLEQHKYPQLCEESHNHRISCSSILNSQVLAVSLSQICHLKRNNKNESTSYSHTYDRRRYKKSKKLKDDIYGPLIIPPKLSTPIISFQPDEILPVENYLSKQQNRININNKNALNQIQNQSVNASPRLTTVLNGFAPSRPLSHVSPKILPLYPFQLPQETFQAPGQVSQQVKAGRDLGIQYKLRDRNRLENINFAFSVISNEGGVDYSCQKLRKNNNVNDPNQSTSSTERTQDQRARKQKQANTSMIENQAHNQPQIQLNQMKINGGNSPLSFNERISASDSIKNTDLQLIFEQHVKENTLFDYQQQHANINILSHRENTKYRRKFLDTPIFSDKSGFLPASQKQQEDGELFSFEILGQQSFSRPSSSFVLHTKQRNSLPQNQNNLFPQKNRFQTRINRYFNQKINNSNNENNNNNNLVAQNHSYTSLSAEKQHKQQQQSQQSQTKLVYQNKRSKSTCQSNINRVLPLDYQQCNQQTNCLSQRTNCLSPQKELNRQTHSDNQINKVQLPPLKNSLLTRLAKYSEMRMQIKSAQNAAFQLAL